MDALTFLRADHESVLGMIESLERGRGNGEAELAARDHLATSLVIAASQHEAVEEQFFWPAVRRALPDGDELADRALAQEESGKRLLQRIDDSEVGTPDFEGALTEFIRALREHIEFEQNQVWPRFGQAQSPQELEGLGEKMATAKKTAPTRPHPATPSRSGAQKTAGLAAAVLDKARDLVTGRRSHRPPDPPAP
ncbi:hemerythrin domain-containing protein [Nocardia bhagyanarayanae]|uniref:Hemerythrin HHE cation binding domain-containing protein n=1 Tax=Nocardia bhagyanarayanae TaxID=1215925 RepID=A0A543EXS2_9NOCA|nr:hemerythrin domain-containing protein [Nocardia bhagyanarayanae]TQM26309.1 hemerythrin HHE cation binding domain-containing protein [Nocardia bhagyanarayanae]